MVPWLHKLKKLLKARFFTAPEARIYKLLCQVTEERYRNWKTKNNFLMKCLFNTCHHMMGMTPETLSPLRKKLTHHLDFVEPLC